MSDIPIENSLVIVNDSGDDNTTSSLFILDKMKTSLYQTFENLNNISPTDPYYTNFVTKTKLQILISKTITDSIKVECRLRGLR